MFDLWYIAAIPEHNRFIQLMFFGYNGTDLTLICFLENIMIIMTENLSTARNLLTANGCRME